MRLLPFLALAALLSPPAAPAALADGAASSSSAALAEGFGAALAAYRGAAGLGALRADPRLGAAAQAHAEDMAAQGYFSHTGRDGASMGDRARRAGCAGGTMAENIAWGQETASDAFAGWAASAPHRANLLGRPYGVFGVGEAGGMWVLMVADGC